MNPGHPGYLGPHDVGGLDWADYANVPLDTREKQKALWEKEIDGSYHAFIGLIGLN